VVVVETVPKTPSGPSAGVVAAEAAVVGAVAGVIVVTAAEAAKPKPKVAAVVVGPRGGVVVVETVPAKRSGPSAGVVAAEAAVVGIVAGAAVGAAVAHLKAPATAPVVVVAAGVGNKRKGKGKGKGKTPSDDTTLNVSTVQLPATGIEKRGDVSFFGIDATSADASAAWRIQRRYNDFSALHVKLGKLSFPDVPFPGKTMCAVKAGAPMESRRVGLEKWLLRVLQQPQSQAAWKEPLRAFLEPPPPAALPASNSRPSAPTAESAEELAITVPAGVVGGQVISVAVPDGSHKTFAVPASCKAGEVVSLVYDASTASLTVKA